MIRLLFWAFVLSFLVNPFKFFSNLGHAVEILYECYFPFRTSEELAQIAKDTPPDSEENTLRAILLSIRSDQLYEKTMERRWWDSTGGW